MKRTVIGIACGLVLVNTLGCVIAVSDKEIETDYVGKTKGWELTQQENRNKISGLELNLSYSAMQELMGTPDYSEQFHQQGANYQVLYYRTHGSKKKLQKEDCTPLVFKEKMLIGWGEQALKSAKGE